MALAWLPFSINLLFFCLSWPQTGLVYIDLKLVAHIQLPPKIWAPKMPNISQKWRKSTNIRHIIFEKSKHYNKNKKMNKIGSNPLRASTLVLWACGHVAMHSSVVR
jgi:hypothetical protein